MIGDDKIAKQNYSVARVITHNRDDIGKFERHIERKNDNYANMNVDLSQSHRNIQFKKCDCTYNDKLNEMVESKQVSLRGLKDDAKVYDEMIFDVNTEYFESHGGYEFAKKFYEQAFHFAEKEMGSEYILSAVMHADEINLAASDKYGYPVYHYHLHVVALPVVQKEIKWSKRCKDKALVGTVKEVVNQVSHSKKWKSEQIVDENGNKILVPSYSLLQDKFFEYMQDAGFDDFVRGEKGSTQLFGTGLEIAEKIRKTIKFELGLTVSIGVSFNKIFAKLGSDMKKPDAITVIDKDTFKKKIWQLPASDLLGVGRATIKKLNYYGIFTIKDLANTSPDFLKYLLGINGVLLWKYANGTEKSLVTPNDFEVPVKSIGHGITTVRDLESNNDVWCVILELIQDIGKKLREYKKYASGIAICIRDNELHFKQWQTQLPQQTNNSLTLAKKAYQLFSENYDWNCDIRSVTVRAINLVSEQTPQQIDLFSETQNIDKMERLDTVVDKLRERFGKDIIKNAVLCQDIGMKSMTAKLTMPTGMCR